jgi:hypothetical protein
MPMLKRWCLNACYPYIDKNVSVPGDGYLVIKADQNHPADIEAAIKKVPRPVRLVADDSSHHPQH